MPAVTNKTQKPLSVALPGGKTLRLGPGKSGQITTKAAENPRLKQLVEAGEIEIADDGSYRTGGTGSGKRGGGASHGHVSGGGMRRSGDR